MLSLISGAEGRWATPADLDVAMASYYRDIQIHKDGTYVETIEQIMQVTKESGKDQLVSYPLTYNAKSTTLKLLEAKTILNGVEYPVDLTQVESKPLASSPKGFDQLYQLLIAFPQVALDAKVYLKYQRTVNEVPVAGFFATDFVFGTDMLWQESQVHIDSELPFFVKANNVGGYLEITQTEAQNHHLLDIKLKEPVIKVVLDEQYMGFDGKLFPWVTLSTLETWSPLGEKIVPEYERVIQQPLPDLYETIAKEAAVKPTTIEKINAVTSRLAENITYMGDWRTIEGAYIPRNLAEIVKTKIGDCKDLSASTVAILRRLGITAHVALVSRGMQPYDSPNNLPTLGAFNHAFVAVQDNLQYLWVDPTNFSSFAQGIYPDVANRPALVLDPKKPALLHTTALSAIDAEITFSKTVTLKKDQFDIAYVAGEISLKGASALPFAGADLRFSKETIDHALVSALSDITRVIKWNIGNYNLISRIVSDLKFNFNFVEKHTQMKTTAGNGFLLPTPPQVSVLLTKTDDRVTDLVTSDPVTIHEEILLPNTTMVGSENSSCKIESPWFSAERKISNTSTGIQVLDELIFKTNKIDNNELKSLEFAKFQSQVFSCFGDTALVYHYGISSAAKSKQ